ncbi:MAG TPA: hypothetical protein VIL20_06875 [Sandaracinaceae bacterium]
MRARVLLAALFLAGCDDLGAYATREGEVYRGTVVGVEDPPVLRRGFAAETRLEMTFDPRRAFDLADPPGRVTTSDGTLTDVALEPIVPLSHDVLGEYEIPAGDRLRNYIFVMHPTEGPLAGREPMAFVSLMGDGRIEVRIIAGGGNAPNDYFGFFRLTRSEE